MSINISVIGAGSMGTAVSILLANNGHNVKMWSPFKEEVEMICRFREHIDKLPGAKLPENVMCTDDMGDAVRDAEMIVLVIPTQTIRQNAKQLSEYLKNDTVVACFSKGLEQGTSLRPSEVILQELPNVKTVALSGPCHAEELSKGIPSAYVAASANMDVAEFAQEVFMSRNFRVYTSMDIVGVELGGALKNVIALCAGISDGLGFGDNTKAALMTRGMAEIIRLGTAMGANPHTFSGLTGFGDLVVTCTSMHSRNRRAGILIGQGKTVKESADEVKMTVEGIATTKAAYDLANRKNITMPITTEAYNVLFNGKNAREAVVDLMMRDKKNEMEDLV